MIKRILHTCISCVPWVLILGSLVFLYIAYDKSHVQGVQDVDTVINQSCNIPPGYCDPSIKALEQELKMSHRINDKQTEFMGIDKAELIDSLVACERARSDTIGALEECSQLANRIKRCSQVLYDCNTKLEYCSSSLEYCINR